MPATGFREFGKSCQDHNTSICTGQDACVDELSTAICTSTAGDAGTCFVTTGNASYCGASVRCHTCTRNADCVAISGAGAACIDCPDPDCLGLGYRTACASAVTKGCYTTM